MRAGNLLAGVERRLEVERNQLPPWVVVGLGTGIAAWFALPGSQPWIAFLFLAAGVALAGFLLVPGRLGRAIGWFAGAALFGCVLVWARSDRVAAPRLERPVVTSVTGTVERVETMSARGQLRLTIRPQGNELPPRVRVSIDAK